jgi:hypothetical protein
VLPAHCSPTRGPTLSVASAPSLATRLHRQVGPWEQCLHFSFLLAMACGLAVTLGESGVAVARGACGHAPTSADRDKGASGPTSRDPSSPFTWPRHVNYCCRRAGVRHRHTSNRGLSPNQPRRSVSDHRFGSRYSNREPRVWEIASRVSNSSSAFLLHRGSTLVVASIVSAAVFGECSSLVFTVPGIA